ncbi:MAG TPA: L-seryl-tRNA(Sec) selenium transferase [Thermodesulfovibrionales bacterium]|nr:L-seryl-tRNA(Sec) selenium transferase [Thermodesulfovibrionales bacterium]
MNPRQELLSRLPSVDEVLKSEQGIRWLKTYPRKYVLTAVREEIDFRRKEVLEGTTTDVFLESIVSDIALKITRLSTLSLRAVINATGIVIHTNLGRSVLSENIMDNVRKIAMGYSNLEYDLDLGKRGKRYAHIKRLLREVTGAEDGFAVNNNAAAVLLCLSTFAKGREVIVSRGELVEIGGSFRVPDVMAQSGALLREVGTTNKTHMRDYENAVGEATALLLKVHQSNYRITGFTEDVPMERIVALGHERGIPVMYDMGSGCLIDLKPYGIHSEPTVQEVVRSGADLVTFSGDKLLGGPQAGLIVGKKKFVEKLQGNPLARAVRIDKLTLAALEATLMEYADKEKVKVRIPTVKMLLEDPEKIRARAKKIALLLSRDIKDAAIGVVKDMSKAGGGSLPGVDFPTFTIEIKSEKISANDLEERLRTGEPPVIARIKGDSLILDARTINSEEVLTVVRAVKAALN